MNDTESEESKAQRFAALPRWKRWLVYFGILNRRFLLMSDAERQTFRTEQLRRFADWPMWKKLLATAGLAVGAIAGPLHSYLFGQLTIGWKKFGFTRTIVASEEPVLFVATLLFLECTVILMLCLTTKVFFFHRD